MKSTLINMVAVLFGITLVSSAAVGVVNMITEEPIAQAKAKATVEALSNVLPEFEQTAKSDLTVDELPIAVYTATASGEIVGYAVETVTKNGFGGAVKLMVGFLPSGEVNNVNVLEQSETPGLGTKMCDEGNPLLASFRGKNPADMKMAVKKDGGDVDALTAATISSRAYVDAMARAYAALTEIRDGEIAADTASGATCNESQQTQEGEENE